MSGRGGVCAVHAVLRPWARRAVWRMPRAGGRASRVLPAYRRPCGGQLNSRCAARARGAMAHGAWRMARNV
ncbi:hypothetical protein DIJ62_26525 [Burkholderia pseudomallei]|nr:hypothetical protein DIJ62_26525 [Burkholderia pseudomallei]